VKAYLDSIDTEGDPLKQLETIDFRLPLYSQERLRERATTTAPPRPINFSPKQPKSLELFQVKESQTRQIELILWNGKKDIIAMPKMEFRCSVYGVAEPVKFSALYEESGRGWQVSLLDDRGSRIGPIVPAAYRE
jgi:hypothetical protein